MSSKKEETKLIVLSAPSGAGKSTLAGILLKKYSQKFKVSISYTTRAPRGKERNGVDYHFVTEDEFKKLISENAFLEYAHVFGKSWYGTSKKTVENLLKDGFHVVFDIDVQGAHSLKKVFGNRCVTIFIHPPSLAELEKRLKNRKTDSKESIEARLKTAKEEISKAPDFDHQIVNRDLDFSIAEIEKILKNEGCL